MRSTRRRQQARLASWFIGRSASSRRQFVVITSTALVVASLGALYAFMAPPIYTAEATIIIDPRRVQLFPGATFAEGQIDSPSLESQIELVKSEVVALSVIRDLRLAEDPEFVGSKSGSGGVLGTVLRIFSSEKPSEAPSEIEATGATLGALSRNLNVSRVGFSHIIASSTGL